MAKKLGDQYIVGPQPKSWGDQSPPVPMVVAPNGYAQMCIINVYSLYGKLIQQLQHHTL